jgi:outer membrane protein assembly factor BamB
MNERRLENLRRSLSATAVAAAFFSLAVAAQLLWLHGRGRADPQDSAELRTLKKELIVRRRDNELKKQIRELDRRVRDEFFQRQKRFERDVNLLAVGLAILIFAAHGTAVARRKIPTLPSDAFDAEAAERRAAAARWATVTVGAVFGLTTFFALLVADGSAPVFWTLQTEETAPPPDEGPPLPPNFARLDFHRQWPRFRGPDGSGRAVGEGYPVEWDAASGKNVLWKTDVPLPGKSSPVVWGDRLFLTGADKNKREIYCFSTSDGRLLWRKAVAPAVGGTSEVFDDTGWAAPTAALDGSRVCVLFVDGALAAFDFTGKSVWAHELGIPENHYGHATSLLTHQDVLFVQFDQGEEEEEKSRLFAFNTGDGAMRWEINRPVPTSWTSPIVVDSPRGPLIVLCSSPLVIAYELVEGREVWRANVLGGEPAPSPVFGAGLVFVAGVGAKAAGIRVDGEGDVTETHVAWTYEENLPDTCSPLFDGKRLYLLSSSGTLTCLNAADGKMLWEHELETSFYASPTLAGEHLYLTARNGATFVLKIGDEFKQIARNELGEEADASPAMLEGRIYLRGGKRLYCLGEKK